MSTTSEPRQNDKGDGTLQPVFLVLDSPSQEDTFEAQAHNRVAKAIANVVENEPRGIVIGLEGSWGSGKSTVVQLIKKHISPEETLLVVFDTWAHQGDPLRRSFLETTIAELARSKWLSPELAEDLNGRLSGKKSSLRTESSARLTREGLVVSFAASLMPLGAVLASNRFSSYHRLFLGLGGLLLLGPFLTVGFFALLKFVGRRWSGQDRLNRRHKWAMLKPLSFFATTQDVATVTEGIEQGHPTSVEFEKIFADMLEASIFGSRRLLIVLDNLDRVDVSDAKTMLTTMQTFMGLTEQKSLAPTSKVFVLIPYDSDGLDRLWSASSSSGTELQGKDSATSLTAPTSAAFVEKIFQLRFEAPPLVLSDWRGHLVQLLAQALPEVSPEEFKAVLRLRALYPGVRPNGLVAQEAPTPRQLKQFVNQIGVIRRLRNDVALVHVAYYVLLRQDRTNVANEILKGNLPHSKLTHLLSSDVVEALAALHFGTHPELAQQLLLGQAIESALALGDSSRLAELKMRSGFEHALSLIDFDRRAEDGGIEFTSTVALLERAGIFDSPELSEWLDTVVLRGASQVPEWSLSGRDSGVGLAILFDRLSPQHATMSHLLAKIDVGARNGDTDGRRQLEGAAGLADGLIQRGRSADLTGITVVIPQDRLVASLAFFGTETKEHGSRSVLKLSNTPEDVANTLVATVTSGNFADVHEAMNILRMRPENANFEIIGRGCATWLYAQDATNEAQLNTLLDCIDVATEVLGDNSLLVWAADSGTLMQAAGSAAQNGWHVQAAKASMMHLIARPGPIATASLRQPANGAQLTIMWLANPSAYPEIIAEQLEWLKLHQIGAFEFLMSPAIAPIYPAWVKQQLLDLSRASKLVVTAEKYIEHFEYLLEVLPQAEFDELTKVIFSIPKDWQHVINSSGEPKLVLSALRVISPESDEGFQISLWRKRVVTGQSETRWSNVLANQNGDALLELAVMESEAPDACSNPAGLADALLEHAKAIADGQPVWKPDGTTIEKLVTLLSPGVKSSKASEIAASLEARDGLVSPEFFSTYGPFLSSEKSFREHAKLPNFIARAVVKNEWVAVEWIVSVAIHHPDMFEAKGRDDAMENLRTGVRQKLDQVQAEQHDLPEMLVKLKDLLAI